MIHTVKNNQTECIGCGACEQRCPQVFRIKYRPYSEVVGSDFSKHADALLDAYYACPLQAIEVEGDHPDLKSVWMPARIVGKTMLTDSVVEVRIETDALEFVPGQYISLQMKDYLGSFNRAYSVVEVEGRIVTLCITILDNGRAGNFLKNCTVPHEIEITGARGEFKLESSAGPKVFVATGTGLVPIIAMMESCPDAPKTLYFGQRESKDLFYLDRLEKIPNLEAKICLDFAEDSWTGYRGRVTDRLAEDGLPPGAEVYACGSAGMMAGVRSVLEEKRHELERYYYESFTGLTGAQDEQGLLNWRQWVRNVHFYASLLLSGVFLFFGLTGFLADRPELFLGEEGVRLPANIRLERAELTGYLKSKLPADADCTKFDKTEEQATVEFRGDKGSIYQVEISLPDRTYAIRAAHPLPADRTLSDLPALAARIAENFPGKLDKGAIEDDGDQVYFTVESVWSQSSVTINKAAKTYEVEQRRSPVITALTNLHRGKKAGAAQRLLIDLAGIAMVLVTITGMIFGMQSRNPKTRWAAFALIAISFALAVGMVVGR